MKKTVSIYAVDKLPPIHPGRVLRDDLTYLKLSIRKFAKHIHVPHTAISAILHGTRSVTPQMAIRLSMALGATPQYWLNLQSTYDLKQAYVERASNPVDGAIFPLIDMNK